MAEDATHQRGVSVRAWFRQWRGAVWARDPVELVSVSRRVEAALPVDLSRLEWAPSGPCVQVLVDPSSGEDTHALRCTPTTHVFMGQEGPRACGDAWKFRL